MRFFIFSLILLLPAVIWADGATLTHEYQLRNGLKLVVREDHRAPVVFSSIWYKVGSSYESNGTTGISHMLEHMMFQGTKRFPPGMVFKIVSQHGGRQNAMTSSDFTAYYQILPAKYLSLSFEIEADRMKGLTLEAKRYASEHQVVLEERRMRIDDQPRALTRLRFRAAALINNPYHHPIIGWLPDLKNLTLDNLTNWYRTWYQPNNAIVVVVGDVQPSQVLALAKQYFANIPAGKVPVLKSRTEIPGLGERRVTVNAPAKLSYLLMGYNVPELTTIAQKWQPYALMVLAGVLDAGDSSRLSRDLVRGKQIAATASAYYSPYRLHNDLFMLSAIPTAGHTVAELETNLLNEVERLQQQAVSLPELNRVKAQVIASNVFQKDSLYQQALDIGAAEVVGLSWRDEAEFVKRIQAVTAAQVQAVAKQYLIKARLTVGNLNPLNINLNAKQTSSGAVHAN
ncbi:MAG: insulinase family protein [Gammaproteobacteria bacterium]|nr:insulinase family protein [Gammaproteobacteria bacterium]